MQNKFIRIYELLRLDKPVGVFLLFWPTAFSITLFAKDNKDYSLYILMFLGSIIMRSAGCIINDIWDRNIDNKVNRTKTRPLASKDISLFMALSLLAITLILGLIILLQLNIKSILAGLFILPFVIIYPSMKRITFFPQVFLGITFNFGVIICSLEIQGYLSLSSVFLYLGCIFWTIGYDTIYGYMDIKDDKKIGVKSLAIYLEDKNYKLWLGIFYSLFIICILLSILIHRGLVLGLFILFAPIILFILLYQIKSLNIKDEINCLNRFKSNIQLGALITMMFI